MPGARRKGLLIGGLFAVLFLAGQLVAWRQIVDLGYYVASNPANTFFYLLSALHGAASARRARGMGRTAAKLRHIGPITELRPASSFAPSTGTSC